MSRAILQNLSFPSFAASRHSPLTINGASADNIGTLVSRFSPSDITSISFVRNVSSGIVIN